MSQENVRPNSLASGLTFSEIKQFLNSWVGDIEEWQDTPEYQGKNLTTDLHILKSKVRMLDAKIKMLNFFRNVNDSDIEFLQDTQRRIKKFIMRLKCNTYLADLNSPTRKRSSLMEMTSYCSNGETSHEIPNISADTYIKLSDM